MPIAYSLLTAILSTVGAVVAVMALYLLGLALASFRYRIPAEAAPARRRLIVLVPAHDEEELIGRCVSSLLDQDYPRNLYRVVVVADNCSDATEAAALEAGAEVAARNEPEAPGKGRALRWAIDSLLPDDPSADAVVIVDADSVASRGLLAHLANGLESGDEVLQADYQALREEHSVRSELAAAAFLLFHRVRFAGRAALGLPAGLVGNGMLLSRRVLEAHPWNAFSAVEDLELSLNLRVAGVRPSFAGGALVYGPLPSATGGDTGQRVRWEGGRWTLVRRRLPGLVGAVARGRLDLADAALDLAVPPLGLLVMATGGGLAASTAAALAGFASPWSVAPWLASAVSLPIFVLAGLKSGGAPASAFRALRAAPRYLAWKMLAYARILRGFDPQRWESPGGPPAAGGGARSLEVADVRIDVVDLESALRRIAHALAAEQPELYQVSTVNLDFLVRAQQSEEVRAVFRRSSLNVADGAPVVWLARLLGHHLPERVPGADLVPRVVSLAAQRGASVFLLGGEHGVAAEAARRLERANAGLRIAGTYEPARASLDEMDHETIVERVAASGADILLVALGHPKQELWIDRHRERLQCRVAIGVGCVFDLIAGRRRRAPAWMQEAGLEWLYRVAQEPRRLAGRYAADCQWLMLMTVRILWRRLRVRAA